MNDRTRELLSAYLDRQLVSPERERVEALLRCDPEARAEMDGMREFADVLSQAAPPVVPAPPDLRSRILDRLRAEGGGSGPGGNSGGAPLPPKFTLKPYLLAGAVMVGLVGSFVYLDQRRGELPRIQPPAPGVDLAPAESSVLARPAGGPAETGLQPARAEDIQHAAMAAPAAAGQQPGGGKVYTFGRGGVRVKGSRTWPESGAALPASSRGGEDVALQARSSSSAPELESVSGWTAQRLAALASGRLTPAASRDLLGLARRYNLNPGLLAAAQDEFPDRSATELALALRASLNASHGQARERRLARLVIDLGGRPELVERWQRYLR